MSDTVKDFKGATLQIGDTVEVYNLIGCEDFKCKTTVKDIGQMNSESGVMCWLDGVRGAWHPGALLKAQETK